MPDFHTPGPSSSTPKEYTAAMDLSIPKPTVSTHSFRLVCDLEPVRALGEGLHADGGQFNWINFTGGHFEASWGSGKIVVGGQDSQHVLSSSHPSAPYSAQLSTRYLLETTCDSEPHFIQVQTRGWRTGPPDVMKRLAQAARVGFEGEVPRVEEYKFRLFLEMECDANDKKYGWLNTAMWVGSGVRSGRQGQHRRLITRTREVQSEWLKAFLAHFRSSVIYDAYLVE